MQYTVQKLNESYLTMQKKKKPFSKINDDIEITLGQVKCLT